MTDVSSETELLRNSVRRMLAATPAHDEAWRSALQMGLTDLCSGEESGNMLDLVTVMMELGRAASSLPVLEAAVANLFAPDVSTASRRISLAIADDKSISCENGCITGTVRLVEGGEQAAQFLILVGHQQLCSLPASAAGLEIAATPALLPGMTDLRLQDTPADICEISEEHAGAMLDVVRLGLCARAYGAAERGVELAIEHANFRKQFGQSVGSFQAIQHKLADSKIALDACRLTLFATARAFDTDGDDWRLLSAAGIGYAASALRKVARETQHTLGAIGFSEEHEAPSLFRRVHADLTRHGGCLTARIRLGRTVLDDTARLEDLFAPDGETVPEFRHRLRDWLARNWTPEDRKALQEHPFEARNWDMDLMQRLGRDGWTTLSWPKSAGGMAATALEQLAFSEEMQRAGAPEHPLICPCRIIAPAIIRYGSQELQSAMLPDLRAGKTTGCLGYSEPGSGSDLASLQTRAERDGEDYVISGQKTWTTDATRASHMILAARTHPDRTLKGRGISLFILPMDSQGITVRPMQAMYGHKFCDVFLDDVRVPASWRLGEENQGWAILAGALASERIAMGALVLRLRGLLEDIVSAVRAKGLAGELVHERIGGLVSELLVAHQLVLRSLATPPGDPNALVHAAMPKVFSSELSQRICETAADILGGTALLGSDAEHAPAGGEIEQMLRTSIMYVVGGGTNEIQRTIIAQRGLGLGRS